MVAQAQLADDLFGSGVVAQIGAAETMSATRQRRTAQPLGSSPPLTFSAETAVIVVNQAVNRELHSTFRESAKSSGWRARTQAVIGNVGRTLKLSARSVK